MQKSIRKAAKSLWNMTPILLSILMAIGIFNTLMTKEVYAKVFGHGTWLDSVIGAAVGSISGGAPVSSYILGGEFLNNGVSLTAVTAFIVAWVSVGLIQFPLEARALGTRFALWRNLTAFALAIVVAAVTGMLMGLQP